MRLRHILLVVSPILICAAMTMPANTLLLARLDAKQVVGGSSSGATATGAFLLNPVERTLAYSLTYQGLENGAPKSIALYNFGRGKEGKMIAPLCGTGMQPCPAAASATISGRVENARESLSNMMIGEFDSERVYVQIVGGNGQPEIRGQLGANGAMVRFTNYTARLTPLRGAGSSSGTAVVSEIYLPGRTAVFYALTAAGTSSPPTRAALVTGAANRPLNALPYDAKSSRFAATGGTLSGSYVIKRGARDVLRESTLVIATQRFPQGELSGKLEPVP